MEIIEIKQEELSSDDGQHSSDVENDDDISEKHDDINKNYTTNLLKNYQQIDNNYKTNQGENFEKDYTINHAENYQKNYENDESNSDSSSETDDNDSVGSGERDRLLVLWGIHDTFARNVPEGLILKYLNHHLLSAIFTIKVDSVCNRNNCCVCITDIIVMCVCCSHLVESVISQNGWLFL